MPRTAPWSRTGVCIPLALLVMGVHCLGPLDLQGLEKEEAAATPSRRGRKGGGKKQGQWTSMVVGEVKGP